MPKPYIICHMTTSIDGKVTGDFLSYDACVPATDIYYELNREYRCNGFICGRVTMETSFTGGWYPDLSNYPSEKKEDHIPEELSGFYAIAFDPKGRLGWKEAYIHDEDLGYDHAQIIEVVSELVDPRYLGYLRSLHIPYIIAGKEEIDVEIALSKLWSMGITRLLLEGGSIVNGYFARSNMIDELSLVVAPLVADKNSSSLFVNSIYSEYELIDLKRYENSVVWLHYRKK